MSSETATKEKTRYRTIGDDEFGFQRVRVVINDGHEGYIARWTESCTGCFESEDGHPVGDYDWDQKRGCYVGGGCSECGYHGVRRVEYWIPFDLDAWENREARPA